MEINRTERLALLTAFDKKFQPELKEAKAQARQDLMDSFATDGTDRKAILVGTEKVGEVGMSYSKAAPFIYQEQMQDALGFLQDCGLTETVPAKGWEEHFELIGGNVVYKPTGEVVEWAGWQPKAPKNATIRGCNPDEVIAAFGNRLAGIDALSLMEGR